MRFQAVDFTPLLPVWSITNNFPPLLEAVQRELDGLFFCVMGRCLDRYGQKSYYTSGSVICQRKNESSFPTNKY
jgi:hypothetical protein